MRGVTRPQRMTRLVLSIITTITFIGLLAQKNYAVLGLAFVSMLQGYAILGFSIKRGIGGKNPLDFICLGIAATGIILWQVTNEPLLAIVFSILADFAGMIPAVIKTYHLPFTESWPFFALDSMAGIFAFLAITDVSLKTAVYPIYIFVINGVMLSVIVARQKAVGKIKQ